MIGATVTTLAACVWLTALRMVIPPVGWLRRRSRGPLAKTKCIGPMQWVSLARMFMSRLWLLRARDQRCNTLLLLPDGVSTYCGIQVGRVVRELDVVWLRLLVKAGTMAEHVLLLNVHGVVTWLVHGGRRPLGGHMRGIEQDGAVIFISMARGSWVMGVSGCTTILLPPVGTAEPLIRVMCVSLRWFTRGQSDVMMISVASGRRTSGAGKGGVAVPEGSDPAIPRSVPTGCPPGGSPRSLLDPRLQPLLDHLEGLSS